MSEELQPVTSCLRLFRVQCTSDEAVTIVLIYSSLTLSSPYSSSFLNGCHIIMICYRYIRFRVCFSKVCSLSLLRFILFFMYVSNHLNPLPFGNVSASLINNLTHDTIFILNSAPFLQWLSCFFIFFCLC